MNEELRLRRARTFDEVAELYDRGRREFPERIIADLFELAGLEPAGTDLLEIGCGTGQATLPLARLGCRIMCVEQGQNLARIARCNLAQFPLVTIVNARFEDWDPGGRSFDMVFAARSWHWLDPQCRYANAAAALRAGGVLAFTTGGHAFPPGFDPFFGKIQECYEAVGEEHLKWPPPPPEEIADAREEIERSGYFSNVRVARHLRVEEFTAHEYVEMMNTASDHRLMEPARRERLFSEMRRLIEARPDGRIRKHNLVILHIACRNSVLPGQL